MPGASPLDRFAVLAAATASLAVAGALVAAVVVHAREGPGEVFPHAHHVIGNRLANVEFQVPSSPGWTYTNRDTITGYEAADGGMDALVNSPAYYRRGWCAAERHWSSRAFVGPTRSVESDDERGTNADLAAEWVAAMAVSAGGEDAVESREQEKLGSGWVTTAIVDLTKSTEPCAPPRARVAVLSLDTGSHIATVVAVQDLDVPDAVDQDTIDRVLESVTPAQR